MKRRIIKKSKSMQQIKPPEQNIEGLVKFVKKLNELFSIGAKVIIIDKKASKKYEVNSFNVDFEKGSIGIRTPDNPKYWIDLIHRNLEILHPSPGLCKEHSKYRGIRRPRSGCKICMQIYNQQKMV